MARAVQEHGFTFERWVAATFFSGYKARSYTEEWDVAPEFNTSYGGVPVSVKTAKYGSPLGLGDALRQFRIAEDFLLIAGFWQQEEQKKRIVNIVAAPVSAAVWKSLWHPITLHELLHLDALIKDRSLSYHQARSRAQHLKLQPPFTRARIVMNPKIDSKTQRRLQCSLGFDTLFSVLAPGASSQAVDTPSLFGTPAIDAFASGPRVFRKQLQLFD